MDLQNLTDAELREHIARIRVDFEDARQTLNKARRAFDRISDDLAEVAREQRRRDREEAGR